MMVAVCSPGGRPTRDGLISAVFLHAHPHPGKGKLSAARLWPLSGRGSGRNRWGPWGAVRAGSGSLAAGTIRAGRGLSSETAGLRRGA